METSTIKDVHQQPSGLWLITTSRGEKYATKNAVLSSLADRYKSMKKRVRIDSATGWYYRELLALVPVEDAPTPKPESATCFRCRWNYVGRTIQKCSRCGAIRRTNG